MRRRSVWLPRHIRSMWACMSIDLADMEIRPVCKIAGRVVPLWLTSDYLVEVSGGCCSWRTLSLLASLLTDFASWSLVAFDVGGYADMKMSQPFADCIDAVMDRNRRLTLFLTTAFPTRLDTANPYLVSRCEFSALAAVIKRSLSRARLPFFKTLRNSLGRRMRRFFGSPINCYFFG